MSLGHWNRPGIGILYGCTVIKGLLLLFIDNSNYQVDADQLEFARVQLESVSKDTPIVILLHIPLMLPGVTLPAKELCGHAQWGAATDTVARPHFFADVHRAKARLFKRLVHFESKRREAHEVALKKSHMLCGMLWR